MTTASLLVKLVENIAQLYTKEAVTWPQTIPQVKADSSFCIYDFLLMPSASVVIDKTKN